MPRFLFLIAAAVTLAACSGPPATVPALLDAREAYDLASADPAITATASDYLAEAEAHLSTAEALRQEKAEIELVNHHAYLAMTNVRTAIAESERAAAEAEIARGEDERRQVQLDVRTAEAEAARRRAEAAQREAEAQRAAAEEERRVAEEERRRAQEAARQAEAERAAAREAERRAAEERAAAQAAQADAERAQAEAERARQEAEEALRRAQELASRVADLEAAQTERGLVLTLGDVLFDVGRSELKPGSMRAIDQLTSFLGEYPSRNVLIEGFTDSSGSDETNLALSQRRADAVRAALVQRGIASNRIQTVGYGEEYPRATNSTNAGRQLNRRVEVIISDETGEIPQRTN
ncbi:MAG: OmpA family protein [Bacteroidota bacterium]